MPLSNDAVRRDHWLELRYLFDERVATEWAHVDGSSAVRGQCQNPPLLLAVAVAGRRKSGLGVRRFDARYDWAWRPHFLGFERGAANAEWHFEQWLGAGEPADSAAKSSVAEIHRQSAFRSCESIPVQHDGQSLGLAWLSFDAGCCSCRHRWRRWRPDCADLFPAVHRPARRWRRWQSRCCWRPWFFPI